MDVLEVRNLCVDYLCEDGTALHAVEDVSFRLEQGRSLGLVGESGCGKTTAMLGMLRLLPAEGRIMSGEVLYQGVDLFALSESGMRTYRWNKLALVFQGAMNALNPVRRVGDQIAEAITCHRAAPDAKAVKERVDELLELVGMTPEMARQYPDKNFLGIDIKGARMWKGAMMARNQSMENVGFLRTRIELIESFFDKDEVDEIWITFPDPQLKKKRNKKRLTGSRFLNHYRSFLIKDGLIHLKTDSTELYNYTLNLVNRNNLDIISSSNDLYSEEKPDENLLIRTHYEQMFLDAGKKITYICFRIDNNKPVIEINEDDN